MMVMKKKMNIPNEDDSNNFEAKQEETYMNSNNYFNNGTSSSSNNNAVSSSTALSSSSRQWWGLKQQNPRIVRVSRTFGGKDRHSKVYTIRGLRDRRIRLSIPTAIQLYDLQDRLGLTQPSKVVDWLLDATKFEIDKLPPLHFPPSAFIHQQQQLQSQDNRAYLNNDSNSNSNNGIYFPLVNNQSCYFPSSSFPYYPQLEPCSTLSLSQFHHHHHDDSSSQNNNIPFLPSISLPPLYVAAAAALSAETAAAANHFHHSQVVLQNSSLFPNDNSSLSNNPEKSSSERGS